jgi:hypothetical protein
LFKAFTNKPEKPEEKEDPQKTVGLRKKNIRDQSPDFAVANPPGIQIDHETKTRVQTNQQENERVKSDHDSHQPRNTEKTEAAFELIEPSHRSATVAQQSLTSILTLSGRERRTTLRHTRAKSYMFSAKGAMSALALGQRPRGNCPRRPGAESAIQSRRLDSQSQT